MPSKIVLIDLETSPGLGWVWGPKWETSVIEYERDSHLLSFAWKFLGEKSVHVLGLNDFSDYEKNKDDDKELVKKLWGVLDLADIVIAHNGDSFDILKANTRFISHGLPPPSPYKTVDTLKIARRIFKFDSNKLDELGRYLGVGRKLVHTGFHLWLGCMNGHLKSWVLMKRYNKQDVVLLEKVYLLLRPWSKNHVSVNQGVLNACPKCSSKSVQKRGFSYSSRTKRQRYQCNDCHGWFEGSLTKEEQK